MKQIRKGFWGMLWGALFSLGGQAALAQTGGTANGEIWIDVRSSMEYLFGHKDGALHIPYTDIEKEIAKVTTDKNAVIHVYCRSGARSGKAKWMLEKMGYKNVINAGALKDILLKEKQSH